MTRQNAINAIPPQITIITSGSGTYNKPSGCISLEVEIIGGGAGGSASSTNGVPTTFSTAGTNTTFGALIAGAGQPSAGGGCYESGLGGTASGGDINIVGGASGGGQQTNIGSIGLPSFPGGIGGSSYFGGAGLPGPDSLVILPGPGAPNSGAGGGGGGANPVSGQVSGAGGGAGGYVKKTYSNAALLSSYSYVVGTGGTGGTGVVNGAAGAAGIIIIRASFQ